jgi:hypothetical protein
MTTTPRKQSKRRNIDTRMLPAEVRIENPIGTVISNLHRLRVPVVEFPARPDNERDHQDFAGPGNYATTRYVQRSQFPIGKLTIEVWRLEGYLQPGAYAGETRLVVEDIRLPLARFMFIAVAVVLAIGLLGSTIFSGNVVILLGGLIPYILLGLGWFFVRTQMRYIVGRQAKVLTNAAWGDFQ